MKPRIKFMTALLSFALVQPWLGYSDQAEQPPEFSKEELEQLVAPIALYPDDLLAQVLMACTYPLEIVSAARFVRTNPILKGKKLEDSLQAQPWDESVKSLATVPPVLAMLNEKLDMTQRLGDAFLAQQKAVLGAVQALRARAQEEGNLRSSPEQVVDTKQEAAGSIISIEPSAPDLVYVPTYDPSVVYGSWPYPAYPPYYYYPSGYRPGTALLSFGAGLAVGHALWGRFDWRDKRVNINVNRYNKFNRTQITNATWDHHAEHRKGVQYRDQATQTRYGKGQLKGHESREAFRGHADIPGQKFSREGQRSELRQRGRDKSGQQRQSLRQANRSYEDRRQGAFEGIERGRETRSFSHRGSASRPSVALIFLATAGLVHAESKQMTFSSPEEAVKELVAAVKTDDLISLVKILGPKAKTILESGDAQKDQENRERFLKAFGLANKLEKSGNTKVILEVGKNGWQFPIPLMKEDNAWHFDMEAGREEFLNRRIGRNELFVVQAMLAYVDAQREYFLTNPQKDQVSSYAQKFMSTKDQRDGLYYPVKEDEKLSPLGKLFANAQAGEIKNESGSAKPTYHGYYYRILKSQGADAPGGAYSYLVRGKLFGGHALVAWPANYGKSGIMTFMVNQDGVVYESDLGADTTLDVSEITKFNPDKTWKRVSEDR